MVLYPLWLSPVRVLFTGVNPSGFYAPYGFYPSGFYAPFGFHPSGFYSLELTRHGFIPPMAFTR